MESLEGQSTNHDGIEVVYDSQFIGYADAKSGKVAHVG
jgi:hypothetical protein